MKRVTIDDLNEGAENPDDAPLSRVERAPKAEPQQALDIAAIVNAAVTAALAAGRTDTNALSEAITAGMQQVQTPKHENIASNGVSVLNPLGDEKFPRPGLKCEMWLGGFDAADDDKVKRAWKIEAKDVSIWEQLALNTLAPVSKTIQRIDDVPMKVIVDAKKNDVTGEPQRLIIGLPLTMVGKTGENRNMVPRITELVRQLNGVDFTERSWPLPEKADDLKWFMAQHGSGNYVSKREEVRA